MSKDVIESHKTLSIEMAKRIRDQRKQKGLSHVSLSAELKKRYNVDISKDSLINYEVQEELHSKAYSNEGMNIAYLRCLADFYGVSTDYLLGLSDHPTKKTEEATAEELGLSATAVTNLQQNLCYDDYSADVLNAILESTEFLGLVSSIAEAIDACKELDSFNVDFSDIIEEGHSSTTKETTDKLVKRAVDRWIGFTIGHADATLDKNGDRKLSVNDYCQFKCQTALSAAERLVTELVNCETSVNSFKLRTREAVEKTVSQLDKENGGEEDGKH